MGGDGDAEGEGVREVLNRAGESDPAQGGQQGAEVEPAAPRQLQQLVLLRLRPHGPLAVLPGVEARRARAERGGDNATRPFASGA